MRDMWPPEMVGWLLLAVAFLRAYVDDIGGSTTTVALCNRSAMQGWSLSLVFASRLTSLACCHGVYYVRVHGMMVTVNSCPYCARERVKSLGGKDINSGKQHPTTAARLLPRVRVCTSFLTQVAELRERWGLHKSARKRRKVCVTCVRGDKSPQEKKERVSLPLLDVGGC